MRPGEPVSERLGRKPSRRPRSGEGPAEYRANVKAGLLPPHWRRHARRQLRDSSTPIPKGPLLSPSLARQHAGSARLLSSSRPPRVARSLWRRCGRGPGRSPGPGLRVRFGERTWPSAPMRPPWTSCGRPAKSVVAAAGLAEAAASGRACGRLSGGGLQVGDASLALDDSSENRGAVLSSILVRGAVRVRGRRRRSRAATSGRGDRRARRRPPSRVARCRSPAWAP